MKLFNSEKVWKLIYLILQTIDIIVSLLDICRNRPINFYNGDDDFFFQTQFLYQTICTQTTPKGLE